MLPVEPWRARFSTQRRRHGFGTNGTAMLIARDFVMVNIPKTGSTFARDAIRSLYERTNRAAEELIELRLPGIWSVGYAADQHGMFSQLPEHLRRDRVVTIARNPYRQFISAFLYRNWARRPYLDARTLRENFPSFPDLSLDDYVELQRLSVARKLDGRGACEPSSYCINFLQSLARDPRRILQRLAEGDFEGKEYLDDLPRIRLLRNERLNRDLADFLSEFGFSESELAPIRAASRSNVTRDAPPDLVWTEKAIRYVANGDRLIFRIFADQAIVYRPPRAGSPVTGPG